MQFDVAQWRSRQDSVEILEPIRYGPITEEEHRRREMMRQLMAPYYALIREQLRAAPLFRAMSEPVREGGTVTFRRIGADNHDDR